VIGRYHINANEKEMIDTERGTRSKGHLDEVEGGGDKGLVLERSKAPRHVDGAIHTT